jgi:hypothetical protein
MTQVQVGLSGLFWKETALIGCGKSLVWFALKGRGLKPRRKHRD